MILHTNRIFLRHWRESDAETLYKYAIKSIRDDFLQNNLDKLTASLHDAVGSIMLLQYLIGFSIL